MQSVPSVLWELRRTLDGSGRTESLKFSGDWHLVSVDGLGSLEVEREGTVVQGIDGEISSGYMTQPRSLELGVLYTGARNQREYYEARQNLLDFVRPNQYKPVRLYVTLPTRQVFYIDIVGNPGAPLSLEQERNHTFLEPVSFIADDPIFTLQGVIGSLLDLSGQDLIAAPNRATLSVGSGADDVAWNYIKVDLGTASGSGAPYSGFNVEIKKSSEADSTYVSEDAGNTTEHIFFNLEDEVSYSMRAIPYNSRGNGAVSAVATQTTSVFVFEFPPTVIAIPAAPSIALSWGAIPRATGYQVRHKFLTSSAYSTWANASGTSHTITGLNEQTTYTVQVRAIFTSNMGVNSFGPPSSDNITTIAYEPPHKPVITNIVQETPRPGDGGKRKVTIVEWRNPPDGGPIAYYIASQGSHKPARVAYKSSGTYKVDFRPRGNRGGKYVEAFGPGGASSGRVIIGRF